MFPKRKTLIWSLSSALIAIPLVAPGVHANSPSISTIKISSTQTTDIWSLAFAGDNNSLYFAENGSAAGVRQILNSQLTPSGAPITTSADGFATFRSTTPSWQNAMLIATPTTGINGNYWVYSTGGNINKPASPTDSAGVSQSGVVWAINTSTNAVSIINTKRSDGTWQSGQMYWIAITPDGKYFYVIAHKGGVAPAGGNEIFKYSTATNTQIGLGVSIGDYTWSSMVADDSYVYLRSSTGIVRLGIDANNATPTRDSAITQMTITGTASSFNFANFYSMRNIDGMLYVTGNDNTMAIINGSTGSGTSFTLTNTFNSGRFFGLRRGIDGCLYAGSTLDRSINRINPHTRTVIASTGAITNFNPYWENSFSISPDGRRYAVSPRTAVNNGFYIVDISGSECAPAPSTTISLSTSNTPSFRINTTLTAEVSTQGRVTFLANNKRIPKCIAVATSGSSPITATCNWRPTQRGSVTISGTFTPNDLVNFERVSAPPLHRAINKRSTLR